jgi:tetratricopeptide (TPR) repeat protein
MLAGASRPGCPRRNGRPRLERTLATWQQCFGPEHPDVAAALNNLGGLKQAIGDLTGAQRCFERALAIQKESLGADHLVATGSSNNLGALLCVMGIMEQAESLFSCYLGSNHDETIALQRNMKQMVTA